MGILDKINQVKSGQNTQTQNTTITPNIITPPLPQNEPQQFVQTVQAQPVQFEQPAPQPAPQVQFNTPQPQPQPAPIITDFQTVQDTRINHTSNESVNQMQEDLKAIYESTKKGDTLKKKLYAEGNYQVGIVDAEYMNKTESGHIMFKLNFVDANGDKIDMVKYIKNVKDSDEDDKVAKNRSIVKDIVLQLLAIKELNMGDARPLDTIKKDITVEQCVNTYTRTPEVLIGIKCGLTIKVRKYKNKDGDEVSSNTFKITA